MYPKIDPRDNEWNRKFGFTEDDSVGFVLDMRLGQTFWAWKRADGSIKFYKCESEVFQKNFSVSTETIEHEFDPFDSPHFHRYPVSLTSEGT